MRKPSYLYSPIYYFGRGILTIILIVAGIFAASAQSVNIVTTLDSTAEISISQPAELTLRLQRVDNVQITPGTNSGNTAVNQTKSGYRIEIYADNNRSAKTEAAKRKATVQARFPKYKVYQIFESPFWRVRLGDFRSRNEATDVMAEIKRAFPSYSPYLRVVRDRIN